MFNDGLSTATSSWVTGLNPATRYEFRVALRFAAGNLSSWSNVIQAETKPGNPLFGKNTAMNVGGADTSSVVAFQDNTKVTLNESELVTLNKGETHIFTSVQYDVIETDKPIFTAGRIGPNDTGRRGPISSGFLQVGPVDLSALTRQDSMPKGWKSFPLKVEPLL